MKSFSELTSASQVDNADILAISQSTGSGYASKKTTVGDVTKGVYASNGKLGAKNLLPLTLDYIKQINTNGTWNNNVLTYRGITYTVNADAQGIITSIDVNGTATNDSRILFDEQASGLKYSGNLLNGKTISNDGGLYVQGSSSPYTTYARINDTGSVQIGNCSQVNVRVFYYVANGNSISNETIYPMIRLASDSDATFQPYAMTNLELTKAVESGGGGTGGHTIIDENGTSMTARSGLQFLGAVEVTDDAVNNRTLVEVLGGEYFYPVIYSTEEREIGVWKDGKPLYQKTLVVANVGSVGSSLVTPIEINDIPFDYIEVVDANIYDSNDNRRYKLPNLSKTANDRIFLHPYLSKSSSPVVFYASLYTGGNTYSNLSDFNVTIQYTKSTDTVGSGSWTPQGVPTHHYSTDEQIIGTWIDGSTLYEKTFQLNSNFSLSNNTWTNIIEFSGLEIIASVECLNNIGSEIGVDDGRIRWSYNSGYLRAAASSSMTIYSPTVTIRYTKSS